MIDNKKQVGYVEMQINNLKKDMKTASRLISECEYMIQYYQNKIENYKDEIKQKSCSVKNLMLSIVSKEEMRETPTMFKYEFPSGNLIIKKAKQVLTIKPSPDIGNVPEEYLQVRRKIDIVSLKKVLEIQGDQVINTSTGEILENVFDIENRNEEITLKINYND